MYDETTETQGNSKGIVSLIIGICSIILSCLAPFGVAAGIVSIVMGKKVKDTDQKGKVGFILGVVGTVLSIAILFTSLIVLLFIGMSSKKELSYDDSHDSYISSSTSTGDGGWSSGGMDDLSSEEFFYSSTEDSSEDTSSSDSDFDNIVTSSYTPAYETMEVGDDTVGYCLVPANFNHFVEAGGTMFPNAVQYARGYIVIGMQSGTTGGLTAEMFHEALETDFKSNPDVDPTSIVSTKESINGIEGYKLVVYYPADAIYLNTFLFDGTDGQLHYISVEYPASETEYYDLFETVVYNYHY